MELPDIGKTAVGTISTRREGGRWYGSFHWDAGDFGGSEFEIKTGAESSEEAIGQVLEKLQRGLHFTAWINEYRFAAIDLTNGACDAAALSEDAQAAYVRDPKKPAAEAAREDYGPEAA